MNVAVLCEHKFIVSLNIISKDFKSLYDNDALFRERHLETEREEKTITHH